jgi:hypothetical protein
MATTKKPAKPARAKLADGVCRYGQGAYGSPKNSKRCGAARNPAHLNRQLCDAHEAVWRVEAKKRAAARMPIEPKPTTTKPTAIREVRRPPKHEGPVARAAFVAPKPEVVRAK